MGIYDSQLDQQEFLDAVNASAESARVDDLDRIRLEEEEKTLREIQAYRDQEDRKAFAKQLGKAHKESWIPWEARSALEGARAGTARFGGSLGTFGVIGQDMASGFMQAAQEYDGGVKSGMEQAGVGKLRKGFNTLVFEAGKMTGQQLGGGLGLVPGIGPAVQGYNRLAGWGAATAQDMKLELDRTNPEMSEDEKWRHGINAGTIEQGLILGFGALGKSRLLRGFGGAESMWAKKAGISATASHIEKLGVPSRLFAEKFSRFTREKGRGFFMGVGGETIEEVLTEALTNKYRALNIPGMGDYDNLTNDAYDDYRNITESPMFKSLWDVGLMTIGTMGLLQAPGVAKSAISDMIERPSRTNTKRVNTILKALGIEENDSMKGRERAKYLFEKLREEGLTQEKIAEIAAAHGVGLEVDQDLEYIREGNLPAGVLNHNGYEVQPGVYMDTGVSEQKAATIENIERELQRYHRSVFGSDVELRMFDTDNDINAAPRGMTSTGPNGKKIIWVSRKYVKQYAEGRLGAFEMRDLMQGVYMHELNDAVWKTGHGAQLEAAIKQFAPEEYAAARAEYQRKLPGLTEAEYDREAVSMFIQDRISNGDSGWLTQISGDLGLFSRIRQWAYKRRRPLGKESFHDLLFKMVRRVAETENIEPVTLPPEPGSGESLVEAVEAVEKGIIHHATEDAPVPRTAEEPVRVKAGRRAKRILDKYKGETVEESNERLGDLAGEEVFYLDRRTGHIERGVLEDMMLDAKTARVNGKEVLKTRIFTSVPTVSASTIDDASLSVGEMSEEQADLLAEELEVEEGADLAEALLDNETADAAGESAERDVKQSEDPVAPVEIDHTGGDEVPPNPVVVEQAVEATREDVAEAVEPEPLIDRTKGRGASPGVVRRDGRLIPAPAEPDTENDPSVGVVQDFDEVMTTPSDAARKLSDELLSDRQGLVSLTPQQRQSVRDQYAAKYPGVNPSASLMDLALCQYLEGKGMLDQQTFEKAKDVLESRTISPEYRESFDDMNNLELDYEILVRVSDQDRQEQALRGSRKTKIEALVEEAAKRAMVGRGGRRRLQKRDNETEIQNGVLSIATTEEHAADIQVRRENVERDLRTKGYSPESLLNAELETLEFLRDRAINPKDVVISEDGTIVLSSKSGYVVDKRARAEQIASLMTLAQRARETLRTVRDIQAGMAVPEDLVPTEQDLQEVEDSGAAVRAYGKLDPEQKVVADGLLARAIEGEKVGGRTLKEWYGSLRPFIKNRVSLEDFTNGSFLDAISNAVRRQDPGVSEEKAAAFLGRTIAGEIKELTRKESDRSRRAQIDAGGTPAERRQRAADLKVQETDEQLPTAGELAVQNQQNQGKADLEETLGGESARKRPAKKKPPKKRIRLTLPMQKEFGRLKDGQGNPLFDAEDLGAVRNEAGNLYFETAELEGNANRVQSVLDALASNAISSSMRKKLNDLAEGIREQFDEPEEGWRQAEDVIREEDIPQRAAEDAASDEAADVYEVSDKPYSAGLLTIEDILPQQFYQDPDDPSVILLFTGDYQSLEKGAVKAPAKRAVVRRNEDTGGFTVEYIDTKAKPIDIRGLLPYESSGDFEGFVTPTVATEAAAAQKIQQAEKEAAPPPKPPSSESSTVSLKEERDSLAASLAEELQKHKRFKGRAQWIKSLSPEEFDGMEEADIEKIQNLLQDLETAERRMRSTKPPETMSPGDRERQVGRVRSVIRGMIPFVKRKGKAVESSPLGGMSGPWAEFRPLLASGEGVRPPVSDTAVLKYIKKERVYAKEAAEVALAIHAALGDGDWGRNAGMASTFEGRLKNLSIQITSIQEGSELRRMREEQPQALKAIVDWSWNVENRAEESSRPGTAQTMPREVATIKMGLLTGEWPRLWEPVVAERRRRFSARNHSANETLSPGDTSESMLGRISDQYAVDYNYTEQDARRAEAGEAVSPTRFIARTKEPLGKGSIEDLAKKYGAEYVKESGFNTPQGADVRELAYKVLRPIANGVRNYALQQGTIPAGKEGPEERRRQGEGYQKAADRVLYKGGAPIPIEEAVRLAEKPGSDWTFQQYPEYLQLRSALDGVDEFAENRAKARVQEGLRRSKLPPPSQETIDSWVADQKKQIVEGAENRLKHFKDGWKDGVVLLSKKGVEEDFPALVAELQHIFSEKGPEARDVGYGAAFHTGLREALGGMMLRLPPPVEHDPVSGVSSRRGAAVTELMWPEFDPDNTDPESFAVFSLLAGVSLWASRGENGLRHSLSTQNAMRMAVHVYAQMREANSIDEKVKVILDNFGTKRKVESKFDKDGEFETTVETVYDRVPNAITDQLVRLFSSKKMNPGLWSMQLLHADGLSPQDLMAVRDKVNSWGGKFPEGMKLEEAYEVFRQSYALKKGNQLERLFQDDATMLRGEGSVVAGIVATLHGNPSLIGTSDTNMGQLGLQMTYGMLGDLNPTGVTHEGPTQLTELRKAQVKGRVKDVEKGFISRVPFVGKTLSVKLWEWINREELGVEDAQKVEALFGQNGYFNMLMEAAVAKMKSSGSYPITPGEGWTVLAGRMEELFHTLGADLGQGEVRVDLNNLMGNFEAVLKQYASLQQGKRKYVGDFKRALDATDRDGKTGWEKAAPVQRSTNEIAYGELGRETLSPGDVVEGGRRGGRRIAAETFTPESQQRYEALRAQARSRKERQERDHRRRSDRELNAAARKKRDRLGWKGILKQAVKAAKRGTRERFNDVDQVALTMTINELTASQKKENTPLISLAMTAAMSITTEMARGLRAAGTSLSEEDQRLRAMHKAVFTPEKDLHHKLEQLRKSGDTVGAQRLHEEWINGEGRYAGKGLPSLHRYLQSMGVDPFALDKMASDPYYANKVLNLAGQHKADLMDGASEWFRNSILGALTTQAANFAGTAPYFLWEVGVKRNLEALVNLAVQDPNLPTFAENAIIFKHLVQHAPVGARLGIKAFKEEAPVVEAMLGYEGRRGGSSKIEGLRTAIKGKAGKVVRIPQNVLLGMDEFMKWTMSNAYAAGYAFRTARSAVKKGTIKPTDSAMFMDRLLSEKDDLVYTPAMNETLKLLWQTPLGETGQKLVQLREAYRPLRFVMPFVVTPINIFKTGVKMSPLGTFRVISKAMQMRSEGKSVSEAWGTLSPDVVEQVVSWMMMYALMSGDEDDPESQWITGSAQEWQSRDRMASRREGVPPAFSVKIGNTWASYERIEPFATVLGTLVDMAKAVKTGDAETIASSSFKSVYGQFYNKTFTRSFADMMDAAHNWQERGFFSGAGHWATNFATAWVPNYIRSTGRALKTKVPERGLWGDDREIKNRTYDRLRAKLELGLVDDVPKVDIWGREIDRTNIHGPASSFIYQLAVPVRLKSTDTFVGDRVLLKWNAKHAETDKAKYPRAPKKSMSFKGVDRNFSDTQYHEYAAMSGDLAKRLVAAANLNVDNPTERDIELITDSIERARKMARKILGPKFFGEGLERTEYSIADIVEEVRDSQIKAMTNKLAEKPPTIKRLDDDQKKLPSERRLAILQVLKDELEAEKEIAVQKLQQLGIDIPTALRKHGSGRTGRSRIASAMYGRS